MKHHSIEFLLCSVLMALNVAVCRDAQAAIGATIDVTTTADEYDIAVPNGTCSLREAVQSANDAADRGGCTHFGSYAVSTTIVLGPATYLLTRIGLDDDANLTSDLDITDSVTITGNGADITFIAGGNGYSGRVLHVVSGTVQLKNLTLKNGNLPGGRSGGGLLTELGTTTTLNGVTVRHNSADGDAGGILNRGTMTLTSSTVTDNHALNCSLGGGGLFNDSAHLTLLDSRVDSNSAHGDEAHGGGIYSPSKDLIVDNTTVANNSLSTTPSGIVSGGGIYASGLFLINQSTISDNSVVGQGGTAVGGGGMELKGNGVVSRSVISGNSVVNSDAAFGGGLKAGSSLIEVTDSVIDGNSVDAGAGNGFAGGINIGSSRVVRSTISNNSAFGAFSVGCGGGALMSALSSLVDSTVVDNHTDGRGGGVCVDTTSLTPVVIASSTITGNESNADGVGGGVGGGLSVGGSTPPELNNTVLAGNLENGAGDHDDCDGTITSLGQVLVQQASGCLVTGGAGNLTAVDPQLGALADNGGPLVGASNAPTIVNLLTRLPLNSSPLIDAGDPAGCKDDNGDALDLDQRGFVRTVDGPDGNATATCDIGAAEFASLPDSIFFDGFD